MNTIKCRRDYMTNPVPGFGTSDKVRVLRHAKDLPGYYIVRFANEPHTPRVAMHESHIGAEVSR